LSDESPETLLTPTIDGTVTNNFGEEKPRRSPARMQQAENFGTLGAKSANNAKMTSYP